MLVKKPRVLFRDIFHIIRGETVHASASSVAKVYTLFIDTTTSSVTAKPPPMGNTRSNES